MKRKRGFTLIELLAVIIILAIIALIATPIVINIIERSRKGAAERSVENYLDAVETQVMSLRANGTILSDGAYGIKANGNICPDKSTTCNTDTEIKIEMSGTKPSSGTVAISSGKVVSTGTSLVIGEYTATIGSNGNVVATKYAYLTYTGSNVSGPSIGGDASSLLTSAPADKDYYLKYKLDADNKVTNSYACARFAGEEYCVEGGSSSYY